MPLTSNVVRPFPSEAYVSSSGEQRRAMADQLTTVGETRLTQRIGHVAASDLAGVERTIRTRIGAA